MPRLPRFLRGVWMNASGEARGQDSDRSTKDPAGHGDVEVQVAFRLGWHVAQLYHRGVVGLRHAESDDNLPGLSGLTRPAQTQLLVREINVELYLLATRCKKSEVKLPDTAQIERVLDEHG